MKERKKAPVGQSPACFLQTPFRGCFFFLPAPCFISYILNIILQRTDAAIFIRITKVFRPPSQNLKPEILLPSAPRPASRKSRLQGASQRDWLFRRQEAGSLSDSVRAGSGSRQALGLPRKHLRLKSRKRFWKSGRPAREGPHQEVLGLLQAAAALKSAGDAVERGRAGQAAAVHKCPPAQEGGPAFPVGT